MSLYLVKKSFLGLLPNFPNRLPSNFIGQNLLCPCVNNVRGIETKIVRLDRQLSLLRVGLCFSESCGGGGGQTLQQKKHVRVCVLPAR